MLHIAAMEEEVQKLRVELRSLRLDNAETEELVEANRQLDAANKELGAALDAEVSPHYRCSHGKIEHELVASMQACNGAVITVTCAVADHGVDAAARADGRGAGGADAADAAAGHGPRGARRAVCPAGAMAACFAPAGVTFRPVVASDYASAMLHT